MNLSSALQNACLSMLSDIAEMHPELRDLQGCTMAEMEKGSERNLTSILGELVALSARGYHIMEKFQKIAAVEMESADMDETVATMNAFTEAFTEGKFGDFDNLSPELLEALKKNLEHKEELEGALELKFGKNALMRMISEDGLMPEFLEQMNKAIYPEKAPERESFKEYAAAIADHAIEGVRKDLN